jgi:hypothetical protein
MTLGNMRANGVRSLDVTCWQCHHRAIMSADPWPDDVPVPAFGPRMVCTRCGIVGADARPNWREQPAREGPGTTLVGSGVRFSAGAGGVSPPNGAGPSRTAADRPGRTPHARGGQVGPPRYRLRRRRLSGWRGLATSSECPVLQCFPLEVRFADEA